MPSHIFTVQMDVPAELEAEFHRVYDEEHVPAILGVPGVRSCTRYRLLSSTVEGVARYLGVYEVDDPSVPGGDAWRVASDSGSWKERIRPYTTNRAHATYERVGRAPAD